VTEKPIGFLDIEVYRNFVLVCIKRQDGRQAFFEQSERSEMDLDRLRTIVMSHTIIGYNIQSYDLPILFLILSGANNERIKRASDLIITSGIKYWEAEKALGIKIPRDLDFIDLIEPQPNPMASLKILNGRLHGKKMQDLPIEPSQWLTFEEMDLLTEYCWNDIEATERLYEALREPIQMREVFGKDIGVDLRSKSDTQMGLALIKHRAERLMGRKIERPHVRPGTSFRYEPPAYIQFKTPFMQEMLERIKDHDFVVQSDGKVDLPPFLTKPFQLGESVYQMGIGGLHSTESKRAIHSNDDYVLLDADCASYYPAIILTLGLSPESMGNTFLQVYSGIRSDRLEAKKAKDATRDKGLKISLNGTFGALGNKYLIVYAPNLLIAVTLTGQLALLMLIERAMLAGVPVSSANTDGVLLKCPRSMFEGIEDSKLIPSGLSELTSQWERDTGFDLELTEYQSIYNASVNSYMAVKPDGKVKLKGPIANPWREGDLRGQMMKNPQMTICSDAVVDFLTKGIPVEDTIRNSRDVKGFVTVTKVTGGATWRDGYLGKVVRFVWSIDGDPILRKIGHHKTGTHGKVPNTDGCRPMMELPDHFPDDIDYDRYISEAYQILSEIGWVDPNYVEPIKPLVFKTPLRRLAYLLAAA
jgi:hypothetical protein